MNRVSLERVIAELAEGQWGLFTAAQARAAGVSRVQLSRLAADQVLTRLAHGIYVLRGAASMEHLELRAAWLGLDPERMAADRLRYPLHGAVVSHASAARLHGLGDLEADRHEFTLPERKQSSRPETRLHRGALSADEVVTVAGLPVTATERVIVDLLADRRDGEHVAGVLAGAVTARSISLDRLAPRLKPFAARFGFPAGAGERVLDHLIELGGVADRVVADDLVTIARARNLDLAEMVRTLGAPSPATQALIDAHFNPLMAEAMRAVAPRSAVQAVIDAQANPVVAEAMRAVAPRSAVQAVIDAQANPLMAEAMRTINAPGMASRLIEARRALKAIEGTGV